MPKIKYTSKGLITKFLSYRIVVLLSNLIFQGIRYMSFGERTYKIFLSIIFSCFIYFFIPNLIISLSLGHFANYIINGQFYVVFRYLSSKQVMSMNDLTQFLSFIERDIQRFKVRDILFIGSFSKGKISKTSDLDIRIFHNDNFLDSIYAYLFATKLRLLGLLYKFPVDVFCFSDTKFLDKINDDEIPVNFIYDSKIIEKYPNSKNIVLHMKTLVMS